MLKLIGEGSCPIAETVEKLLRFGENYDVKLMELAFSANYMATSQ